MASYSWLEIQTAVGKSLSCPLCGALVVERKKHQEWHLLHVYTGTPEFWQAKADELQLWVGTDPKEQKAV